MYNLRQLEETVVVVVITLISWVLVCVEPAVLALYVAQN